MLRTTTVQLILGTLGILTLILPKWPGLKRQSVAFAVMAGLSIIGHLWATLVMLLIGWFISLVMVRRGVEGRA